MEAVEKTLFELNLDGIPRLRVFNKEDQLNREEVEALCEKYEGVSISALHPESLEKFFQAIRRKLWEGDTTLNPESRFMGGRDNVRLTNEDSFDISNQKRMVEVRENDWKSF